MRDVDAIPCASGRILDLIVDMMMLEYEYKSRQTR
jgi:hypothetical protein